MPFQMLGFTEKIRTHAKSRTLLMGNTLPLCLLLIRLGKGLAHTHSLGFTGGTLCCVVQC